MTWMTQGCKVTVVLVGLMLSACVYRIDIQQGNFLEAKDIDRLSVGMTRVQVRSLLGTPMVSDPFESARWDYVYYLKRARTDKIEQRHYTVFFEGDKVSRIQRSDQAEAAKPEADSADTAKAEPTAATPAEVSKTEPAQSQASEAESPPPSH